METRASAPDPAPRRIRDPELRRAAILQAALTTFSELGYARATVREIARRAGVTHGLVQKHFGTKEQLFLAAVPGVRNWSAIVAPGDADSLPERIAAAFAKHAEAGGDIDVLVALLRSAASDVQAAKALYLAVQEAASDLYAPFLVSEDARLQTDLLISLLIGVTFSRKIIGVGPLAELAKGDFEAVLANAFRQLLHAPSVPPPASSPVRSAGP